MRHFMAHHLGQCIKQLENFRWVCVNRQSRGEGEHPLTEETIQTWLEPWIGYCRQQCDGIELRSALSRIDGPFRHVLKGVYGRPTWNEIHNQITVLIEAIESELCFRRFAYVPTCKAEILDRMAHDWEMIWAQFPLTKTDSQEAVYCYALGRNTACVFHLMRVAEIGLRALAREMRIVLPKKKLLEWAQWQDIIKEMNKAVDDMFLNQRAGPKKDAAVEFYRGAIGEFSGFKDAYRNNVMHSRASYDESQAKRVLLQVSDFMNRLSSKINERGRRVRANA